MRITPVPCLRDNYAYLLIDGDQAAVVDPSDGAPVVAALAREGTRLVAILATHHHADHVGGVADLLARYPGVPVYGHRYDHDHQRILGQTVVLEDGQGFSVLDRAVKTLHVPGHTLGAVSYHFPLEQALFTGDTLFLAGCGRLFEGTAAMMHASLQRLAALPAGTRVYCGHEYTESNLRFAAAAEPDNAAVLARQQRVAGQRAAGQPTVPATLAEEQATNPFLRVPDAASFAKLRQWKDSF